MIATLIQKPKAEGRKRTTEKARVPLLACKQCPASPLESGLQPTPAPRCLPFTLHPSPFKLPRRRGISLMEVLMAIFVLTTGLLGIAMVIPAGRALMVKAAKNDRSAACGRAVLNDVQIRGWSEPENWRQYWGATYVPARITTRTGSPTWTVSGIEGGLVYGETYFFDPLFFAANNGVDSVRHFPYTGFDAAPTCEFVFSGRTLADRDWPDRALARRVTVPISQTVADRITTWADELIFSLEADNVRPRQMCKWLYADTTSDPSVVRDPSENSAYPVLVGDDFDPTDKWIQHAVSEPRYTWSVMFTPLIPPGYDGTWDDDNQASTSRVPLVDPAKITRYEVSVVIFYNRNFYCPPASEIQTPSTLDLISERSTYAQIVGGGIGGGDVLLFVPNGDASRPAGYLDVKKDDWIMLKALDRSRQVGDGANTGVMFTRPTVCKWYRVLGADDEQATTIPDPNDLSQTIDGRGRYVTLAGPDWAVDTIWPPVGTYGFNSTEDIAEAAIIKDVVGVYTTVIDTNAL